MSWVQAVQEVTDHRMVAIDGKTVPRGSSDHETGRAAIHMVSAWATENKLSLGQVVVDEKSNEITAIPELLQVLEISGALVTIDAMGCQKEIADQIREREADFVLAVKQNQPTLYEQVEGAIDEALEQDAKDVDEYQSVEKGHGRRETRTYAIFPARSRWIRRTCGVTSARWGSRSRNGWTRKDDTAWRLVTTSSAGW